MTRSALVRSTGSGVPSARTSRRTWRMCIIVVTAAALITLTVVLRRWHEARSEPVVPVQDFDTLLSRPTYAGLPDGLVPAWPVEPMKRRLSKAARAVRIGARNADLGIVAHARAHAAVDAYHKRDSTAIAIVARNSALTAAFAGELADMLDDVPDGATAAAYYRQVELLGRREDTIGSEIERAQLAIPAFGPQLVAVGNWLEYARVAALRGDRAFFRRAESQAVAAGVVDLPGLSSRARARLGRVQALVSGDSLADLAGLERALTEAVVVLAN